ncbi:hypothetical protein [Salmonella enterica]|nr:hypothetical protein [Salmonella enterica]
MPFPSRPLCSDDLSHGIWRETLEDALRRPYIPSEPTTPRVGSPVRR